MNYIYKITNVNNGMVYVGQTTKNRPTDRFTQHKYLANHPEQEKSISYLHRAMSKDGVDNFIFEIIEEIEAEDEELLNEREKFWIKELESLAPNGYNISEGGSGTPGFSRPQTAEERKKKGNSVKAFYENHPEARIRASEQAKKKWEDEDFRRRVIEGNKRFHKEHPDFFTGENNPFYGKHHSEETLAKIKEASKKRQKPIGQYDKDTGELIKIFDGVKDAERALGVSHGWLSKAANQGKIAYGYKWKFLKV